MKKDYNTCLRLVHGANDNLNYFDLISKQFSQYISNINIENNFIIITFLDNTNAEFFLQHPDIANEELLEMKKYYAKVDTDNKEITENLIHHLNLATKIMYIMLDITSNNERTNSIINCVFSLTKELGGIIVRSNRAVYNSDGQLVLDGQGKSETPNFYASVRKELVIDDSIGFSDEDKGRIEKNIKILQANNVPYNENMKLIPSKSNTKLNNIEEVFCQLIEEFLVATVAITFDNKNFDKQEYDYIYGCLNSLYSVDDFISDDYKKILEDICEGMPITSDLTWLFEKCAILMWVLNLWDFPKQDSECDMERLTEILLANEKNQDSLPDLILKMLIPDKAEIRVEKLQMRSYEEILDKADLLNRYKWACDEARINNKDIDFPVSMPVLNYQLKAFYDILNWDPNKPIK